MVLPVSMTWDHLLFASWPVPAETVAETLPPGLTVDTYDDRAWLSVVPFVNADVRLRGIPRVAGFDLPEVNLRTYVRHDGDPGVYFYSLDAEGLVGVFGARVAHFLPYYAASMDLEVTDRGVAFASKRRHPGASPAQFEATYEPIGKPKPAPEGSLAEFLTERYRYYTTGPGGLRYANVYHDRWPLRDAVVRIEENTLPAAAGFDDLEGSPVCSYATGLEVRSGWNRSV